MSVLSGELDDGSGRRVYEQISRPPARAVRCLVTATVVSASGDGVRFVALPLLALKLAPDPRAVALVYFTQFLPWLLFTVPAGTLVDRLDNRRLMIGVDTVRTVIVGAAGIAVALGHNSVALLAALGFLVACGEVLMDSATSASLPTWVARPGLEAANGKLQAGRLAASKMAGPLVGALLWTLSPYACFLFDALSYGTSAVLLCFLPRRPSASKDRAGQPKERWRALSGIRWVMRHRRLRALVVVDMALSLVAGALLPILVLFCRRILHLNSTGYSLVLVASAVGGVMGALLAGTLVTRLGRGVVVMFAMAADVLVLAVGAVASALPVGVAAFVVFGAATALLNVLVAAYRQSQAPPHMAGRIASCHLFVTVGCAPVGALVGGLVAHVYGLRAPLAAGALLLAAAGLAAIPAWRRNHALGILR
ncbi:MFS transporter [Streptomyces sp. NPDC056632]|uniref:MFS transporter n=1 Tax=Streptomyces sp. NPDC056632 TaxID=3345884 RepID=UPI00367AB965